MAQTAEPYEYRVLDALCDMIGAISPPDGYWHDWETPNQMPGARSPGQVHSVVVVGKEEVSLDIEEQQHGLGYTNESMVEITVFVPDNLATRASNTNELYKYIARALDDLKRVMRQNPYIVENVAGPLRYRGKRIEMSENSDIPYPTRLITQWVSSYVQSSLEPSTVPAS